jgi:hypothetical protein
VGGADEQVIRIRGIGQDGVDAPLREEWGLDAPGSAIAVRLEPVHSLDRAYLQDDTLSHTRSLDSG